MEFVVKLSVFAFLDDLTRNLRLRELLSEELSCFLIRRYLILDNGLLEGKLLLFVELQHLLLLLEFFKQRSQLFVDLLNTDLGAVFLELGSSSFFFNFYLFFVGLVERQEWGRKDLCKGLKTAIKKQNQIRKTLAFSMNLS